MKNTLQMLQEMERELCIHLGGSLPDFDDIYHASTDEELEAMAEEYARTHSAPNTNPIYV